jgi:hypothetical protein
LGVATEQILPNDVGLVGTFGVVGKLNLSAFTAGDVVYLDSIPGKLTKVKPQAPYHMVFVGIVERANAGNGLLFVNVQNGYELEELHNVRITSPVNNRAILAYDSVARLWKDTTLNGIGGVTGSGTANYVTKWTGTNTTGNSSIQDDGTNVSVNANFILNGLLDEPIVSFRSSTGATTYGNIKGTSTGLEFIANGSRNLIFTSNGSERIRVTSGGDVGIGTSSPAYKLDVNGSGRFSSDIVVNSVNVGKGAGSGINNVAIGSNPLSSNTTGAYNIAIGTDALAGVTSGARNIGIGENAGKYLVSSAHNIVIGNNELNGLTSGSFNTIIGSQINSLSNISNHIILADGSGNQRIVVDAAGDVGIGTSTPDSALTVVNGALFQRGVRMSGLPTAAGTRALRVDANGTLSVSDTLANGISGSGTTNYIPKFTSSSAIGNSLLQETSGNITLENNQNGSTWSIVKNNNAGSGAAAGLLMTNDGGDLGAISLLSSTNSPASALFIRTLSTNPLVFGTNSTERMRLDASGNLGIGTSSPAQKLQVVGGIASSAAISALAASTAFFDYNNGNARFAAVSGTTGAAAPILFSQYSSNGSVGRDAMTLDASGNLGLGVTPSAWSLGKAYEINSVGNGLWSYSNDNIYLNQNAYFNSGWKYATSATAAQYIQFQGQHIWNTAASGTAGNAISFTQAMTLDANSILSVRTTSTIPDVLLPIQINAVATTGQAYFAANNNGSYGLLLGYDNVNGYARIRNISNTALTFETNNTERMRLDALGNLGIGTTSPDRRLTIGGTISAYMNFNPTSNTNYVVGSDVFGFIVFDNASSAYRMTINSSGNVGIGTTSPASYYATRLVTYANNEDGITIAGNGGIQYLMFADGTSGDDRYRGYIQYSHTSDFMAFASNAVERMRLTSTGNVGIGTTSPAVRLDVLESGSLGTASSGTIARFTSTGASGFDALIGIVGGNAGRSILDLGDSDAAAVGRLGYDHTSNFMFFNTNSAERMRITSGGEVYIAGTTDQGAYNLQVNGTGVWGAGAYVDGSDSAVKKNIQPLGSALDLIKQMNPVTFEYQPFYSKDTTTQTGFIAQELQQVLSDKVYKNGIVKEGGQYLGVAYQHLIPLLVKSIQELEAQVQALKSQLNK